MEQIKLINFDNDSSDVCFITEEDLVKLNPQLIICDSNTEKLFTLPSDWKHRKIVLTPGEESKHLDTITEILKAAVEQGLDRKSLILGIGGGVLTDMTAFAASLYMRGCRVALIPTTLLAMVDAAVGGKTGVDFSGYKNMVGSFYPAEKVWIDPSVLKSLSEKEYRSGMAEVIKTAILGDKKLLELMENNHEALLQREPEILKEVIGRCVQVKGRIVEEDLKEKGIRTWLNLGHTFGHALEAASGFSLVSHGEAVAWGIDRALDAGLALKLTTLELAERIKALLDGWSYKLIIKADPVEVQKAMFQDKKKESGTIRFVLIEDLENMKVGPVDNQLIKEVLDRGLKT